MELKWLEDLVMVVEKGHFAKAADARNITQSAFSRRIKSLEIWAGTELLDRSKHPVSLTQAGWDFLPHAREMIRFAYQARGEASEYGRIAETGVTIACLHTLAMFQIPTLVARLREQSGAFEASIIAETRIIEQNVESLINGSTDFFACYRHEAFPFDIDSTQFPRLDISLDRMLPYVSNTHAKTDFAASSGGSIPYLEYSGTSFMSRVVMHCVRNVPFRSRMRSVYRATLAECLCTAAINGLGVAWLPETVVTTNPRASALTCIGEQWQESLPVTVYRSAANRRPVVERLWETMKQSTDKGISPISMQPMH